MIFEKELKKFGLKDKEAAVYVSCLQLGPTPVQMIARKAGVVRATTYVILDSLMQMGLVTKYKEGKKTLFSAEPPRQLLRLLERERENIEEKKHDLDQLLPELQVLMKSSGGRPSVRFFAGREGLHVMRQEIVMYAKAGETIYNFTPVEHLHAVFPLSAENADRFVDQRLAKGVKARTIFSTANSELKDLLLISFQKKEPLSEYRYVHPDKFPGVSGMTIFGDRIAIGTFTGKQMGVIIESSPMAHMMSSLFNLAWEGADTFD